MNLPFNLTPKNTALIVVDKQLSYTANASRFNQAADTMPETNPFNILIPKIDAFIEVCRAHHLPIVWTQMIEDPVASPKNIRTKMIADGTSSISDPNSPSFAIQGLQPEPTDTVIVKPYYDSFAQTDLHEYLQANGIETVILVGGYASRCVLGTAYGANGHGYNVVVVSDLVGNPDRFASEVPSMLQIVNSILGYALPQSDIHLG